jgi:hypothetical protein
VGVPGDGGREGEEGGRGHGRQRAAEGDFLVLFLIFVSDF